MLAIQAANEKERQREIDLLGIQQTRPGANGDPKSPQAANYDESKADVYPNLPDPLLLENGKRVTTAKQWWTQRRPQIVGLFDEDILGRTPARLPGVKWEVVSTVKEKNGDFPVITKKLIGHVDNSADPAIQVEIELELSTPANATGPVPVILELGFSKQFMAELIKRFPQFAQQMQQQGPTWQQQVLAKGWGYAEYVPASVQPDNAAGLTEGIIGLVNKGKPRKLDDWGALKAWGWGASKCLDYFQTDGAVDAKQVGIEGHSRYGKAALVTMAYDPRFAIGYISSSGEAGAKLYRHIFGEEVGNIAAAVSFHWMAGNFLRYDGPLNTGDLPVDAHELIALCAPRPVFISGGATQGDGWVDAKGMFLAAAAAGPVYRLLGKKDLGTTTSPPIETTLIDGDIAFRQHTGGHTPAPNWPTFITFASRYLRGPPVAAATGSGTVPADPAPVHLTAEQDRERLLRLLGLTDAQMRRPPVGDRKSPNATNYDESKANVYPKLPDPLLLKNGLRVTTAEQWWSQRRPEIVADYEREILGRAPDSLSAVTWEVVSVTPESYRGIDVLTKRLVGHVDNSSYPAIKVNIDLVLFTPAHAPGPVPVLMELAFAKDYERALTRPFPEPPPPGTPGHWGVDGRAALERGWGFAVLNPVSFQADDGSGLTEGIIGLMNKGQPRGLNDWGTMRAWSWGASRALDYFESDPAVNAKQIGLVGHSRFGKTVLVAMAFDPRFVIAYSSSSGEGGAKLYRHIYGEQMSNVTSPTLYHWFCGNFLRYGGPLTAGDLPVDNHELIALAAPRPIFISGGSNNGDGYAEPGGDAWADPKGMFLAVVAAGPVYKLLDARGLGTKQFPPLDTTIADGDLAWRQHQYGHTPAPNWPAFLDFAANYLHAPQSAPVLALRSGR
jgi:dienelactone hydrolase